jgi:hypothetical protein
LKKKTVTLAVTLIAVVLISLFVAIELFGNESSPEFLVGVEFAYSNGSSVSEDLGNLKNLVDKVKGYTNLFVVGLPQISLDQAALNEACDYIHGAGLHFIILFTNYSSYTYVLREWTNGAQQKYGEKFLGAYRIDEPGGRELDNATNRFLNPAEYSPEVRNYLGASEDYVEILQAHLEFIHEHLYSKLFTADYAFYWFDYKAGFDTVLTEFGWNHSRQINIALCRGAAKAYNRDWGALITWTYRQEPFLESAAELYDDMVLAYNAGAKYVVVFDHPNSNSSQYGVLNEEHFEVMRDFWDYIGRNSQNKRVTQGRVAYVLPDGYGFGFRSTDDHIWGMWGADELSPKIWNDANKLVTQYGSDFDIVFEDAELMDALKSRYDELIFWNETVT